MVHELVLTAEGATPIRRAIEGSTTVGGSRADAIHVAGLPPGAAQVEPSATGLVLSARAPGLKVGGKPVPPGGRRLLRPGERAQLLAVELSIAGRAPESTRSAAAAVLRGALLGEGAPVRGPALVVLDGPEAGTPLPLRGEQVIGRGRSARLRLEDPATSRSHARLRLVPGGATVEDLGAKNGLRVNGVRIEPGPVQLRPGDELTLGETTLAFQAPEATAAAPPPPTPKPGRPGRVPRLPRRARAGPRVPIVREPAAALVWAVLLAVAAAGLLAAACAV